MARVLIADDHALAREGYKQFLEGEPSIKEIGEAATGNQTMEALRRKAWDLLLMDIQMPDGSGLEILRNVKIRHPKVRVLIVSGLPEKLYARNVLRAGANGYLSKDGNAQELLKAVRLALRGRRYVSQALSEAIAAELEKPRDQHQPFHLKLSTREFQIMCKLAAGSSVSATAIELNLSVKTISTYRGRMLDKMGFKSNADVTAYALGSGLIL
jgi:two-component system, NarL family, invasion response regulator UvrY